MIRVGLVGVGFMGWIHYLAYQRARGVKVAALVSRDAKKRAGDWRGIRGNFGPPGQQVDLRGAAAYEDLDQLLSDPQIDLVDICLPPYLHAEATVRSLAAGKHVFCEKPIAVSLRDADRMVAAAERHGRQLLIGQVLPFFAEYAYALSLVRSGRHGRLLGGHLKRMISDPLWLADFYDPQRVGGPLVDLHIHDAHWIRLACGQPKSVFCRGSLRNDVVERATTQFIFEDPRLVVSAATGVINQQGRPFTHGFELNFEKATLLYDFAVLGGKACPSLPLTLLRADGRVENPKLPEGDEISSFVAEINEVVRSIRRGQASEILAGRLARDALALCHAQTRSAVQGRLVAVR